LISQKVDAAVTVLCHPRTNVEHLCARVKSSYRDSRVRVKRVLIEREFGEGSHICGCKRPDLRQIWGNLDSTNQKRLNKKNRKDLPHEPKKMNNEPGRLDPRKQREFD